MVKEIEFYRKNSNLSISYKSAEFKYTDGSSDFYYIGSKSDNERIITIYDDSDYYIVVIENSLDTKIITEYVFKSSLKKVELHGC